MTASSATKWHICRTIHSCSDDLVTAKYFPSLERPGEPSLQPIFALLRTALGECWVMHVGDALPLVAATTPMGEALLTMSVKGFDITAVTADDGTLIVIVTDGDLRRNLDNLMSHCAGEIATRSPVTAHAGMLVARALALMNERKISVLSVVDEQSRPVGILHVHDCLRAGVA